MAELKRCDMCGKISLKNERDWGSFKYDLYTYDLCPECNKEVAEFIESNHANSKGNKYMF